MSNYYLDKDGLSYFYEIINNKFDNISNNISDQYSSTDTYNIGDYSIYNNQLYRCNTDISVAEAWNSNHWDIVLLSDEIKSKINKYQGTSNFGKYLVVGSDGDITIGQGTTDGGLSPNIVQALLGCFSYLLEGTAGQNYYSDLYNALHNINGRLYTSYFDFTKSAVDRTGFFTPVLDAAEGYNPPTRTSSGIVFSEPTQGIYFGILDPIGKTFEFDVANFSFAGDDTHHIRLLMFTNGTVGTSPLIFRTTFGYNSYGFMNNSNTTKSWSTSPWTGMQGTTSDIINMISGKTVKLVFVNDHTVSLYLDDTLIGTQTDRYYDTNPNIHTARNCSYISFGGIAQASSRTQANGDQCYNLTLSGFRVYENES